MNAESSSPAAAAAQKITADLRDHLALCDSILREVEREHHALKAPGETPWEQLQQAKKGLLLRLNESLDRIREDRRLWQSLGPETRERNPEIPALLRQNQDLIMKIMVLGGENEQAFLKQGLLTPKQLPSANRQRPHFVAELYRKNGGY